MTVCAVNGCKTNNDKRRILYSDDMKVSFHRFPKDETQRNLWLHKSGRDVHKGNSKFLFVCAKHFRAEDFVRNLMHEFLNYCPRNFRKLKDDAVPSLYMPDLKLLAAERKKMKSVKLPVKTLKRGELELQSTFKYTTRFILPKLPNSEPKAIRIKSLTNESGANDTKRSDKPVSAVERNYISGSIETVVQKQQHETSCYKTKLLLQPVADLNAASSSNKSLGNVKHDTVSEIIERVIQEEPEICTKTTPVSDSFKESKIDWERAQSRFIDHVVMAYLNRCRSRAGSIKMTMPNYILKEKAEQTALLLGTRLDASLNRLGWLESFKKKIIENDEKGVILTSFPESLNLIDIINDEWPIFATEYGLDDCEHPDSFSIENAEENLMDTEIDPISDNHACIMEVALDDLCSSSLSQPIEVTNISETTNHDLTPKFLKHVVKIFVKRFKATWPKANIPEFIYSAKLKEAAFILGYPIKKKQSIRVFKKSIQRKIARETDSTEPNQSFEMKDIIEEEMPKFNFDKQSSLTDESDLEDDNLCRANNKGCLMQIDDEGLDGIHTYEEAKDCLSLLQNYALEVKDLTAVALLDQINAYLRSEDCKD